MTTTRPILISVLNTVCEDEAIKKEALRRFHLYMKNGDGKLTVMRDCIRKIAKPNSTRDICKVFFE